MALSIVWAAWTGWSLLGQASPYILQVTDDVGVPIASAVVDVAGDQAGTTDTEGMVEMEWNRSSRVLEVSAPGHISRMVTLDESPGETFSVVLNARVLRGRVVDADGEGIASARVTAGPANAVSDEEGHFQLRGAEPGPVTVVRPAWLPTDFIWDGGPGENIVAIEPFTARAVHISGEAVANDFDRFVDMAMTTELNALMIDLKDESGYIWYNSTDPTAIEAGAVSSVYDLSEVVSRAHSVGLYVIGRLVIFQDPVAAKAIPAMAVWDTELNEPYSANGQYFLDPTDPDARAYAISLAVEACEIGVDEIQFDYVRFPDARRESAQFDEGVNAETRTSTINAFLSKAVEALHPLGCAVAADIFGFLTTAKDDGGIGQQWEEVTAAIDVASPMLYPSHYGPGWFGFENPNEHPADVVRLALEDGMERLTGNVVVRPWLQDFGYSTESVRAQIDSTERFNLGWMLWNAQSIVTVDALDTAE
ncbi:MAG: putative glycoside hydrolase [Acidimicrobiia bacterium]